jgi:hypothetical protein
MKLTGLIDERFIRKLDNLARRSWLPECKRCGSPVPADHEKPKYSKCEGIKFERDFFTPKVKRLAENFKRARAFFGLTGLYLYGSYPEGEEKCGDVDVLVTYDKKKLSNRSEALWDFRKCEEYPDCLPCFESGCPLPSRDYDSPVHTYCVEKCAIGDPLPRCAGCPFWEAQKEKQVMWAVEIALLSSIEITENVSGMDVKVVDLYVRESVEGFENEFIKKYGVAPKFGSFEGSKPGQ